MKAENILYVDSSRLLYNKILLLLLKALREQLIVQLNILAEAKHYIKRNDV